MIPVGSQLWMVFPFFSLEIVISSSTNCSSSEEDTKRFIESFVLELLLSLL